MNTNNFFSKINQYVLYVALALGLVSMTPGVLPAYAQSSFPPGFCTADDGTGDGYHYVEIETGKLADPCPGVPGVYQTHGCEHNWGLFDENNPDGTPVVRTFDTWGQMQDTCHAANVFFNPQRSVQPPAQPTTAAAKPTNKPAGTKPTATPDSDQPEFVAPTLPELPGWLNYTICGLPVACLGLIFLAILAIAAFGVGRASKKG